MNDYIDHLKRTNNGREIAARKTVATAITTCENNDYGPKFAIWAALTLLGELVVNVAALADSEETEDE